jgi:hypothetical protein
MNKENDKGISSKINSLIELFKKIKFVVLALISLVVLGVALMSGDRVKIFSTFYEKTTGLKHEIFLPIEDFSNEPYLILRDKLSRNQNIQFENAVITTYKESETLQKYRVVIGEEVSIYKVAKDANGAWKIKKQ